MIRSFVVALTLISSLGLARSEPGNTGGVCMLGDPYRVDLTPIDSVAIPARGHGQLTALASPFGIAVSAAGHHRYRLSIDVQGMPNPASLGAYRVYVAWLATPLMDQTRKLGVVKNGTQDVGEVSWNKFRLIITAEASGDVKTRSGPVVLRGISPSARLQPHDYSNIGIGPPC
jgi:hypothetical protein